MVFEMFFIIFYLFDIPVLTDLFPVLALLKPKLQANSEKWALGMKRLEAGAVNIKRVCICVEVKTLSISIQRIHKVHTHLKGAYKLSSLWCCQSSSSFCQ